MIRCSHSSPLFKIVLKILAGSSTVEQQVGDLVLSLLWLRFNPQPGNFHMLQAQPRGKKNQIRKRSKKESNWKGSHKTVTVDQMT